MPMVRQWIELKLKIAFIHKNFTRSYIHQTQFRDLIHSILLKIGADPLGGVIDERVHAVFHGIYQCVFRVIDINS
jgi:hypothetical protein